MRIVVLATLVVISGPAFAQFNQERPDLRCWEVNGELRVTSVIVEPIEGIVVRPEPVWLEPMPNGWKAAHFEVLIEDGKCKRRPVSRNLDQEDLMLQHDARNARKAAREAVKNDVTKLRNLEALQGADESVVDENTKIELPRIPNEKRAEEKARIAKEAADAASSSPREQ